MPNKKDNDEIDLIETLIVIWDRKWSVILILALFLVSTFTYKSIQEFGQPKKKIVITSQIKPVSAFDEAKYKMYSTVLKSFTPIYLKEKSDKNNINQTEEMKKQDFSEGVVINNINKKFLYELFIDKLNQKSFLSQKIKEFNYLKKENYPNKIEYENEVFKLVSSFKLLSDKKNGFNGENYSTLIQYETTELENWENLLKFIDKETNISIQNDLSQMFNNYLDYSERLKVFSIEDIDVQLSLALSDEDKSNLIKLKSKIMSSNYVERMREVLASTPISSPDNFYAAKIVYDSILFEISDDKGSSMKKVLFIAGVFGLIFGILLVLIVNTIKNRI